MSAKHTSGRWTFADDFPGDQARVYTTETEIAWVKGNASANARLIAQAPALLEALKWNLDAICHDCDHLAEQHTDVCGMARDAIDKAEGR